MKHLIRNSGIYQFDAVVSATWPSSPSQPRSKLRLFAFCDTRQDAVRAVCSEAEARGYTNPTVDHIVQHRRAGA